MRQKRIALIGKSGAGKSTVSSYLRERHGFVVVKTGQLCRSIAMTLFGNDNKSTTQLLDDALTAIDPSIFLKAALRSADLTEPTVLDALRFSSDLDIVRRLDFITLRVEAGTSQRIERLKERGQAFDLGKDGAHRSETELDQCDADFKIKNGGSIAEIYGQVDSIVGELS